jgi:hypothetical protein
MTPSGLLPLTRTRYTLPQLTLELCDECTLQAAACIFERRLIGPRSP